MQQSDLVRRTPRVGYELVFETVRTAGPVFRTPEALEAARHLGMSVTAGYQALAAATKGGIVERLRSGLYLAAPPLRSHEPHEFLIATRAVPGSVIAGVSALSYWGLIDQVPMRLVIAVVPRGTAVPRPTAPSVPGTYPSGLNIRGLRYVYRRVEVEELIGVVQVQVDDDSMVPIFDRERMVIDTLLHPRTYGASTAAYVMSEHDDDLDHEHLGRLADALNAKQALERTSAEGEPVSL